MQIVYPAVLDRGKDGFGVSFPDLPGCVSFGKSEGEAFQRACEALQMHLEGMLEDGESLPNPSRLDSVPVDPEIKEVSRILVPASLPEPPVKLTISIDPALLRRIDEKVKAAGWPGRRSGFLAAGAKRLLEDLAEEV